MNLQQLRYVHEAVRRGLNLTEAAAALHTSQPGVSRQIRELEEELGVEIFVRKGKRLVALTAPGRELAGIVGRALGEIDNLRAVAQEFRSPDSGELTIATTHTQARYSLPTVVAQFKREFPRVHLTLQQANPRQVAEMVIAGVADLGIATEALDDFPGLLALPGYSWQHCVVAPVGHPLLAEPTTTLESLARFPIVTYDTAFAGRTRIDHAFAARGLEVDVVLSAIDSDVIKTYVELGLGIGIIAAMAYDPKRDTGLRAMEVGHLFGTNTTRIALARGRRLRGYVYRFVELFAPQLNRASVEQALSGGRDDYEL
jgi:LysR family cys regulon transcriptional activator